MVSSRITSFFAYWITTETSALVVSFFRYKSLFEEGKKRTESLRISPVYSIFDARYIKKTLSKDLNRERERERERERHSWTRKYFSPFDQIPSNFSFNNNDREKGMAAIA